MADMMDTLKDLLGDNAEEKIKTVMAKTASAKPQRQVRAAAPVGGAARYCCNEFKENSFVGKGFGRLQRGGCGKNAAILQSVLFVLWCALAIKEILCLRKHFGALHIPFCHQKGIEKVPLYEAADPPPKGLRPLWKP